MEKSKQVFGVILSFAKALESMYHNMHWKSAGDHYYSDHLLYERLYGNLGEEIDQIAEKALGIFDDQAVIKPSRQATTSAAILSKYMSDDDKPEQFPEIAIKAEKDFIKVIDSALDVFGSEGVLTPGIEDMFPAIVNTHEGHLYLLQQRNKTKEAGMRPLPRLYKLAYHLDKSGLYNEARKIEEVMEQMAERVGLTGEDIVSLADHFDSIGDTALANYFDELLKK